MARPLRIEYPGAVYHVMARGHQARPIFGDDTDRRCFLQTLGEACAKTGWLVHAYVVMGNHYHLLLETPEGNLVAGMKWLQGVFTQRHNGRHGVFGHLFQGRYKSVVVDGSAPGYFDVVGAYIHLNPVRAGLIRAGRQPLQKYLWSSYPAYLKSGEAPAWLRRERVLGALGLTEADGRRYQTYMESRALELGLKAGRAELEAKWKALRRGWYLGEERFLDKLKGKLGALVVRKQRESHSGGARRIHDQAAAQTLLKEGLAALNLDRKDLLELPIGAAEKTVLAWWLRQRTTVPLRWVGQELAMGHYSRVSQAVSRMQRGPGRRLKALQQRLVKAEKHAS
jgi:putative transposase